MKGHGFYEAAAQVIPLLWIVGVLEKRILGTRGAPETFERWLTLGVTLLLFVAELMCLAVLAAENSNTVVLWLVATAVAVELGILLTLTGLRGISYEDPDDPGRQPFHRIFRQRRDDRQDG
jgi:hypothetical protein